MLARRKLAGRGRFIASIAIVALLLAVPLQGDDSPSADLEVAIARTLLARLGHGSEVAIDAVEIMAAPLGSVVEARLAPGARVGSPLQFRLATMDARGSLAWTGAARVRARLVVTHTHAARPLARGTQLSSEDVELVRHEIATGPIAAWPLPDDLVRGRLLRDVAGGACLTRTAVSMAPAVQNGQSVIAIVRIDGVEATARLIATDSGETGAVIRVINEESRRVMKARIVSAGTVEILQ
jgi:flagella basal body P-ring formation protein FlgA